MDAMIIKNSTNFLAYFLPFGWMFDKYHLIHEEQTMNKPWIVTFSLESRSLKEKKGEATVKQWTRQSWQESSFLPSLSWLFHVNSILSDSHKHMVLSKNIKFYSS